jgi:hypothetical protein
MVASRARWAGLTLFVVFCALAFQLRQRDLEFIIEADFQWTWVEQWRQFLSTLDPKALLQPTPGPYLDGSLIVYGLMDILLRFTASGPSLLRSIFPTDQSFALGAATFADIAAYAAASTIFYAAACRVTGSIAIAAVMAAGFFFAPQMLEISITRIDFINTLPLALIFYSSCILVLGEERKRHAVILGIAMAFAATIKINGLFFGIIPACAAIAIFRFERQTIRRIAVFALTSLTAFASAFAVLMARYLYFLSPAEVFDLYIASIDMVKPWATLLTGPPAYYNIDLLMGHGKVFIVFYLACAAVTGAVAIVRRDAAAIFLSLCFVTFSAAGLGSIKYSHGGYHLLPIIFSMIGFTGATILRSKLNTIIKIVALIAGAAALLPGFVTSARTYEKVVQQRRAETIAIVALFKEPRDWLVSHIPLGSRICVQSGSTWTLPPLEGFIPIDGPLRILYLDRKALADTYPPSLEEVARSCRAVVTSDYHRRLYRNLIEALAPVTAAKWETFFQDLNTKYPPIVFTSPASTYATQVYINDLN